jgi:hypothetical protein
MTWPHQDAASMNAFYGDPRGGDNGNPGWVGRNIVLWEPPYPMFYSDGKHTHLPHIRVHLKCVQTFTDAFKDVLNHFGPDAIKAKRLDITGGVFCYRLERGGSKLSVHSWGCAIDMDPGHNPFPSKWKPKSGMIDPDFAAILQGHGFTWRGAAGDNDPMHFQLCTR